MKKGKIIAISTLIIALSMLAINTVSAAAPLAPEFEAKGIAVAKLDTGQICGKAILSVDLNYPHPMGGLATVETIELRLDKDPTFRAIWEITETKTCTTKWTTTTTYEATPIACSHHAADELGDIKLQIVQLRGDKGSMTAFGANLVFAGKLV